jgi:hypothetical protein
VRRAPPSVSNPSLSLLAGGSLGYLGSVTSVGISGSARRLPDPQEHFALIEYMLLYFGLLSLMLDAAIGYSMLLMTDLLLFVK